MRILLADGRSRVRFALRALLEEQPGFRIVGEADSGRTLLAQIEATWPDALLLSWELPGLAGAEFMSALRQAKPNLFVIVLSGRRGVEQWALVAGADAFVSKVSTPEHLLAAIKAAQEPKRRSTMTEVTGKRRNTLGYAAILAIALVGLAMVVACTAVSLTLISEIPFHHIFPH